MEKSNTAILYFDGECNLCNSSVQKVLTRDKKGVFQFASLQGKRGQEFLKTHQLSTADFQSFILEYPNGIYYTQSDAVLEVLKNLGKPYNLIASMGKLIPRRIRNSLYSWIAQNRYQWFGTQESCMLPQPEWKNRFLD